MDHAHMRDTAQEVSAKIGMGATVLALRPVPGAVGQDRFELVVDGAADVGSFVDHDAGKLLAHALAHKPAFLEVQGEALLGSDDGNRDLEAARGARQSLTAGKSQIISVAGIDGL